LTVSRSSFGIDAPRIRLMGFLDLPEESLLLMAAPAATPSTAVPPAISGVFAFPAVSAIVAAALFVCSTAVCLIASTLLLLCELDVERFLLLLFVLELRGDRFDAEPLPADEARDPLRLVERLPLVFVVAIPLLTCAYRSSVLAAASRQSLKDDLDRRAGVSVGNALADHSNLVREFSDALAERADVLGSIRQALGRRPRGPGAKANAKELRAGGSP
jgi:hypothetical protein